MQDILTGVMEFAIVFQELARGYRCGMEVIRILLDQRVGLSIADGIPVSIGAVSCHNVAAGNYGNPVLLGQLGRYGRYRIGDNQYVGDGDFPLSASSSCSHRA